MSRPIPSRSNEITRQAPMVTVPIRTGVLYDNETIIVIIIILVGYASDSFMVVNMSRTTERIHIIYIYIVCYNAFVFRLIKPWTCCTQSITKTDDNIDSVVVRDENKIDKR